MTLQKTGKMVTTNTPLDLDFIRTLIGNRVQIIRQKQTVSFDAAMEAYITIARLIVPDYEIDSDNEFAIQNLVRWVISDPTMKANDKKGQLCDGDLTKGIYLQGPTGTGKSLALDILRIVCRYFDQQFKSEGRPVSLCWKTARAEDICYDYEESGNLKEWKQDPIICIQDLGSEPSETLHMGNRRGIVGSIIEARGDLYSRLTIISSNIRFDRLEELYGPRVSSRLTQMCNIITLNGPDRRK